MQYKDTYWALFVPMAYLSQEGKNRVNSLQKICMVKYLLKWWKEKSGNILPQSLISQNIFSINNKQNQKTVE